MAAQFNVNEVIELVQREDSDQDQSYESEEDINEDEERLSNCLDSFDGGEGFNKAFFKENAIGVLLPLVQVAKPSDDLDEEPQRLKAAKLLSSININAGSLLMRESRLWLDLIMKRLAGKVTIRRPYFAEIIRSIPYDIFAVINSVIRNADDEAFLEPACYLSRNKKAEVISFTSLCSLQKLFSMLSGMSTKEVKKFFSRKLSTSSRSGHKVKLIVEEAKDFGFFYKKPSGKLAIQFHYGEWNIHGFPRHNCAMRELSPSEL